MKKFVDLGVRLPVRKKNVTTTLQLALMHDGAEIETPGYCRFDVNHMRTLFEPKTGNLILEVDRPEFGATTIPAEVDGFALMARDTIIMTHALPDGPVRFGPMKISVQKVRLFKVPLIK